MRHLATHDDRAVGQRVRRDRCDHDRAERRVDDRPAAGEGVGGRAGRTRDHEAVAAMRIDEAAVDPDLELDHAPGFVALHDHVVERAVARGLPVRARELALPAAGGRRSRNGPPARRRRCRSSRRADVGQEAEPPAVDAEQRHGPAPSASCAANSIVPSPPIATIRSASRPSSRDRPAHDAVRQAVDRDALVEQHRRGRARAGAARAPPSNRRRGCPRPCRPGRCGRSACSSGFAAF